MKKNKQKTKLIFEQGWSQHPSQLALYRCFLTSENIGHCFVFKIGELYRASPTQLRVLADKDYEVFKNKILNAKTT